MKKTFLLLVVMAITLTAARAQETTTAPAVQATSQDDDDDDDDDCCETKKGDYWTFNIDFGFMGGAAKFDLIDYPTLYAEFGFGYNGWLRASFRYEAVTGLFNNGGVKTWEGVPTYGGSLEVIGFRNELIGIGAKAAVGCTTGGNNNWAFTYYQAGIQLHLGRHNKINYGIGVRYFDSQNSNYPSFWRPYVSLSFLF